MAIGDKNAVTMAVKNPEAGNLPVLTAEGQLHDSGVTPSTAGVRVNLLDNPHFKVNQRGKASYSVGYGVDRWISTKAGLTVEQDGIIPAAGSYTYQRLPGKTLTGRTLTFSVLFADGTLLHGTNTVSGERAEFFKSDGYIGYIESKNEDDFQAVVLYEPVSKKVAAMKLELGNTQTLAQQIQSRWELLEQPNYAMELLECQRYLLVVPGTDSPYAVAGTGGAYLKTNFSINIPAPVFMRTKPSVAMTGNWTVRSGGNPPQQFAASSANCNVYQYSANSICLDIGGFTDLPVNQIVELLRDNNTTASIVLTAEV